MRRTDFWYILKLLKDIHFSLNFFLGHLLRYVLYHHEWVVLVNGIYATRKTAEAAVDSTAEAAIEKIVFADSTALVIPFVDSTAPF